MATPQFGTSGLPLFGSGGKPATGAGCCCESEPFTCETASSVEVDVDIGPLSDDEFGTCVDGFCAAIPDTAILTFSGSTANSPSFGYTRHSYSLTAVSAPHKCQAGGADDSSTFFTVSVVCNTATNFIEYVLFVIRHDGGFFYQYTQSYRLNFTAGTAASLSGPYTLPISTGAFPCTMPSSVTVTF